MKYSTAYNGKLARKLKHIFGWSLLLFFILFVYSCFEPLLLKVNRIDIVSSDIPPAFDGKRIVFLSDVHHGEYLSMRRVKRLVRLINQQNADLILMGGDYSYTDSGYIRPFFEEFKNAHSKYGKFAVLGNHDFFVNASLTRKMIRQTNIYSCDNLSYWVKLNHDSIKIGGVGETENEKQYPRNTTHDVLPESFCIMLCHQPSYFAHTSTPGVDLTLSGHTHGGQLSFFGFWSPILPTPNGLFSYPNSIDQKYRYGLVRDGVRLSYITSGVGSRFPPLRFSCRPEIVVFTLHRVVR